MKSVPRLRRRTNRETQLVCQDLRTAAILPQQKKALRVASRKTAAELAAWLRNDFHGMYGKCRSPECGETLLQMAATRLLLGRIDWEQVAVEVLAMAGRKGKRFEVAAVLARLARNRPAATRML